MLLQNTKLETALKTAADYAKNNECKVLFYCVHNGTHQVLYYEFYQENDSGLKNFNREPDYIFSPDGQQIKFQLTENQQWIIEQLIDRGMLSMAGQAESNWKQGKLWQPDGRTPMRGLLRTIDKANKESLAQRGIDWPSKS